MVKSTKKAICPELSSREDIAMHDRGFGQYKRDYAKHPTSFIRNIISDFHYAISLKN